MHVEATIRNTKMQEQAGVANTLFEQERFVEAFEEYSKMANAGSVEAQLRVAWMYQTGHGVKMNLDDARCWYLMAAKSDSAEAQFHLGYFYELEKKYSEAMNCFRKSAVQNHMPSIYQLGVLYELGKGVERDKEEAYKCYEQAARMGHLRAQREMGLMIIKGYKGVKRIPQGILTLIRIPYKAVRLALKNIEDDRLRW